MRLRVLRPGLLTTVQDLGRWGFQARGVPVAGAMDPFSLRLGNLLLGNDPGAAALEVTLIGPEAVVEEGSGRIALAGADLGLRVDGVPVPAWTVLPVREGSRIGFGGARGPGARAYLCVAGGIDVPLLMGSRSTYARAGIGGLEGRPLRAGDCLCAGDLPGTAVPEGFACPEALRFLPDPEAPVPVLPGPQAEAFGEEGLAVLCGGEYRIAPEADRMGYRLEGPEIPRRGPADIVSDAIPLGAIQVPGHGRPIVMMADRQTTGGYTKIAVCSRVGTARLAQRISGAAVRFVPISLEEALESLRERARAEEALVSAREEARRRVAPSARGGAGTPEGVSDARSRGRSNEAIPSSPAVPLSGVRAYRITVEGRTYEVLLEEIR